MQRFLIHGENTIASRQKLLDLLEPFKAQNIPLQYVSGRQLTPVQAELLIGENSLFSAVDIFESDPSSSVTSSTNLPEKILIIEELHSLPLGKKRTALIDLLIQAPSSILLIFWEKKKLTALMIKKLALPSPKSAFLFEPSSTLWKFLDALSPNPTTKPQLLQLYQQTLVTEDAFYLQALLNRQIRLLIQIKTGPQPRLAPFQASKFVAQAKLFTLDQLLQLHHQLLLLEYQLKTSRSNFDLAQEIFLILANL